MPGNRKPQQLPPSVAENKKCEELLKGNRRNYKEINRCDPVSVVAQEGLPCLRGATSSRYHVVYTENIILIDEVTEPLRPAQWQQQRRFSGGGK
jgi:hypothetical protein